MYVVVEVYNPVWAQQFEVLKGELEIILAGINHISIEHVGSTSVPGLAAKPTIDLSVISEREDVNSITEALCSKGGYDYMGLKGIPDRHAFRKPDNTPPRNLYVSVKDCQSIKNQLAVRDICRRDPNVRDAYGQAKLELAQREWRDADEYCEAKNDIVGWVLEKAGLDDQERAQIRKINTTTRG
ncbi:hypothetical protein PV10_02963 [Exophiala mesophila]|uniref:Uncharacterized protein n=1 Tax=Exophiala mesophila TaxID=212818 RepID=A0A0D1X0J0_EXOME|nr:uncharacterized protein PV10_02963 [Exophiala mesophila]KIV95290.1 hypothetical protein PV10_02963 [Exophiala mesophila]